MLLFFKIIFIIYFCLFFPGVGLMDDWLNGIMENDCGIYCVCIYIYIYVKLFCIKYIIFNFFVQLSFP